MRFGRGHWLQPAFAIEYSNSCWDLWFQRWQLPEPANSTLDSSQFSGDFLSHPPSSSYRGGQAEEVPADAELVSRVLRGEAEAYRPLVERYQRAVFGLAVRLLGNGGDADDLAQEAFLRAYRYLGSLKRPERFGPWLFQVVRSLARDRNRRREVEKKALERRRELLRWEAVPNGGEIGSALYRLTPAEYLALRLRYFEGMSYEEIARQMGKTFSQVDHLIRKARAHLARNLSRERARERSL